MPDTPAPLGPYSPVVAAGDFVVTSGQLGTTNGVLEEGVGAQTRRAIANLGIVLESAGAELRDVVKTTVFLTDMGDFAEMNAAYADAFGDHRPARSAVAVRELPFGAGVEIEAWAYLPRA